MPKAFIGGAFLLTATPVVVVVAVASASRARAPAETVCSWDERRGIALRGSARGDVDGDDQRDEIAVIANYRAPTGCRLALRVRLASQKTLFLGLDEPLAGASADDLRRSLSPRLVALATVDAEPGAEIVVNVDEGASTGFVRLFTLREHELVPYRIANGSANQSFAYGAGGLGTGVDCWRRAASGYVVASEAEPNVRGWTVRRSVYRVLRRTLVLVPDYGTTRTVKTVEGFPELRELTAFQRCTVVKAHLGN